MKAPDAVFPHTEKYEIPLLRGDKQGKFADLPVRGWGSVSRQRAFNGTWHFYVDDRKFTAVWKHPETLTQTRALNVVEVNYSLPNQMPFPEALHRLYKKRWLSRFWQDFGIDIFVDLNVDRHYWDLNLEGVPEGWSSYATVSNDLRLSILEEQAALAEARAGGPITLLVYGGVAETAKICEKNNWIHVRQVRNERASKASKES